MELILKRIAKKKTYTIGKLCQPPPNLPLKGRLKRLPLPQHPSLEERGWG